MSEREPFWVATANGEVRHPVRNWGYAEGVGAAKRLLCREHPTFVHLCSSEESNSLRPCRVCEKVMRDHEMINMIIKDI